MGPGPNVFSNSAQSVYVDNYGLHLNILPMDTAACTGWSASEVSLAGGPLGYGTYLWQFVGPVQHLDPNGG